MNYYVNRRHGKDDKETVAVFEDFATAKNVCLLVNEQTGVWHYVSTRPCNLIDVTTLEREQLGRSTPS